MNVSHMLGFHMLDIHMWSHATTSIHIVLQVWSNVNFCKGGAKFPPVTCDQNLCDQVISGIKSYLSKKKLLVCCAICCPVLDIVTGNLANNSR